MVDREVPDPTALVSQVIRAAGLEMESCKKVRPSLEDVFVASTQARKVARDHKE